MDTYQPRFLGRTQYTHIAKLRYELCAWGPGHGPLIVALHGWMDVAQSFQFLVDHLPANWRIVAPNWRGYGGTDWSTLAPGIHSYWFMDYLADLDGLLDILSPNEPVVLLGHSMGGMLATLYAGVRRNRVKALINLDGLGFRNEPPSKAPIKMEQWLNQVKSPPRFKPYASREAVAKRLLANNKRLRPEYAMFLAGYWAAESPDGLWHLRADPAHKMIHPIAYRSAETAVVWEQVECPMLLVEGAESDLRSWLLQTDQVAYENRLSGVKQLQRILMPDVGHMLHHDDPEKVASYVTQFIDKLDFE